MMMCPGEIYKFAIKIALAVFRNAFQIYVHISKARRVVCVMLIKVWRYVYASVTCIQRVCVVCVCTCVCTANLVYCRFFGF